MLILSFLGLIAFLYGFASIAQYFKGLGAPRIFSNFIATSVTFASFNIKWPKAVIDFFNFIRSLNFIDIDLFNPECEIVLSYQQSWLYTMLLPLLITGILLLLYFVTVRLNPKSDSKERKDPDKRTCWLQFPSSGTPAWLFVNTLHAENISVYVLDEIDGQWWSLLPTDRVKYQNLKRRRLRLWKTVDPKLNEGVAEASYIVINISPKKDTKDTIYNVENGYLNPKTIKSNIADSTLSISAMAQGRLNFAVGNDKTLSLKRVTRFVRSRTATVAGRQFSSDTVESGGRLIASVASNGRVECANSWAQEFSIDKKIDSSLRQFKLDKVHIDIDGASSTAILTYTLKLRVQIYRKRGQEAPCANDDLLAEEYITVSGAGIVSCDFGGLDAISHRYRASYWLVVQPISVVLVGENVNAAQWYWRCAQNISVDENPLLARSCLGDLDYIDSSDLLAHTSTKFIPRRQGLQIVGLDSWNNWSPSRCIHCAQEYYVIQNDPARYGTDVICKHQAPFAFNVTVEHPNAATYTIFNSFRAQREIILKERKTYSETTSKAKGASHQKTNTKGRGEKEVKIEDDGEGHENDLVSDENGKLKQEGDVDKLLLDAEMEGDSFPDHQMGRLLEEMEVHLGYTTSKSKVARSAIKCMKYMQSCCFKCGEGFRGGIIGQAFMGPISLLFVLLKLSLLCLVYLMWLLALIVGGLIWFVICCIQSVYGLIMLTLSERHVLYLYFHVKILKLRRISWRYSIMGFFGMGVLAVIYVFLIDVLMGWAAEKGWLLGDTSFLLEKPHNRFLWLAPVFLSGVVFYAIRGAPKTLYNLERLDPIEEQNIRYEIIGYERNKALEGTVIQRFGDAIAVARKLSQGVIDVMNIRNVLQVGIYDKIGNGKAPASSKKAKKTDRRGSKKNLSNHARFYTTSGKLELDMDSKDWLPWAKRIGGDESAQNHDRTSTKHLTWYDKTFSPFLLRYVLTTHDLPNFSAHRNALMLVKETHQLYSNHGELINEHRSASNSYINAFMILFISLHLSLTKRVFQAFICTEQPNGSYTLTEDPETICINPDGTMDADYSNLTSLGWFFMLLYAIGIPVTIAIVLESIFREKRECQPSVRDRYGYLYYKYTNANYLWEPLVILPRKATLTLVRMLTRQGGAGMHRLQAASCLLIVSLCALLHISRKPFIEESLNNMESAALLNHIFVLFIGLCFLSDAITVKEDTPENNSERENIFASVMIGSMSLTMAFLFYGVLKELWEGGIISMGSKGLANIVINNFKSVGSKIKKTTRSHWALRSIHNFCRKGRSKKGDTSKSKSGSSNTRALKSSKVMHYHAPAPPRHCPPTAVAYDWTCPHCLHENSLHNNSYAVNCEKCKKRRIFKKFNIGRSLAEKKKSLLLDKQIKDNVLLSDDAQYAALQWGIYDRSTTLRETKWLIEALEFLSKNILEVYFNVKQMSIQQEQRNTFKENYEYAWGILHPFKAIASALAFAVKKENDDALPKTVRAYWSVERDEISRQSYYIYSDPNSDRERFREVGWYEFFDGDRGQLYYSKLGEAGWEISTWKRPHEKNIVISRGSKNKISIVKWKKPTETSRLSTNKLNFLEERLLEFDIIMDTLRNTSANKDIDYPNFYCFKDVVAEILKMGISHHLLEFKVDEHAEKIRKELVRRILSMPLKRNFDKTDNVQVKVSREEEEAKINNNN